MIPPTKPMQRWMSRFMLLGTLAAMAIVFLGGLGYLATEGMQPLQSELLTVTQPMDLLQILGQLNHLTPLSLIELGLALLIAVQVFRILWLFGFYILANDHWFTFFTGFILCAILYSLLLMR